MKKAILVIYILWLFIFEALNTSAQNFEVRMTENTSGYIDVQMRETTGTGIPTTSTDIVDIQFAIRWNQSFSNDLDMDLICSEYRLIEGLGSRQDTGEFYWRVFAADNVPFKPQDNWVINQWVTIGQFKTVNPNSSDTASFAVAPEDWVIQGLNINIDGNDHSISVSDSISEYPYPTLVYDFVWKGGAAPSAGYDENSWTYGLNWENPCGMDYSPDLSPNSSSNCIIPAGLTYYPGNFNNISSGSCHHLKLEANSALIVPMDEILNISGELNIGTDATLNVASGGTVNLDEP